MISNEAYAEAQVRGVQKTLAFYGLEKAAAAGVLATLGRAGSRALSGGMKAYQHGGGSMMQNVGKGIASGAKSFQRAGGLPAAGKALGATAAVGAGAYGAGRAFGAGQAGGQKQASDADTLGITADDAEGIARTIGMGFIPFGNTAQGVHRGSLHGYNEPFQGAVRMLGGTMAGGMVGGAAGAVIGKGLGMNRGAVHGLNGALTLLGSGVGGHLATRKYLKPPEEQG
jgi:hypothetical protein